jgi:hypothetical protein
MRMLPGDSLSPTQCPAEPTLHAGQLASNHLTRPLVHGVVSHTNTSAHDPPPGIEALRRGLS